jgi:nucleoside-diphosphate-sugar epimerase
MATEKLRHIMNHILITGASGQLGVELVQALADRYGKDHILATDIRPMPSDTASGIPFELLDILDQQQLHSLIKSRRIDTIYHLAAILSARGEEDFHNTWRINMKGLLHILDAAREHAIQKVFWPSSIAVFGKFTDSRPATQPVTQHSPLYPATVYGISKSAGEQWCAYYHRRYGLDVRSLRYPGLIGYKNQPGGGTTDYAVEMLQHAISGRPYTCYLKSGTRLPMMYMDDAVSAALRLMDADPGRITVRTSYNIAAMSFTPEEIAGEISDRVPEFIISYRPDHRQAIADSWPDRIDDAPARSDWGWKPAYDLKKMLDEILVMHHPEFSKNP